MSITQAFNTISSMGRLTLNVVLSFAQFEREVIGERVRAKIAAPGLAASAGLTQLDADRRRYRTTGAFVASGPVGNPSARMASSASCRVGKIRPSPMTAAMRWRLISDSR
jgi:hypothetical protein